MGRVLRGALVVVVVIVMVAVLSAGGLLAALTASGQPRLSGTVTAPGLSGEVRVSRDASGVVHITAGTSHDLFYGQGWVHASERMWQMDVCPHVGSQREAVRWGTVWG